MKEVHLYGKAMETRAAAHDQLMEKLELPAYYGRNLDALWDCLTERSEPLRIVFHDPEAAIGHLGAYGKALIDLLEEASRENTCLKLVLLAG